MGRIMQLNEHAATELILSVQNVILLDFLLKRKTMSGAISCHECVIRNKVFL